MYFQHCGPADTTLGKETLPRIFQEGWEWEWTSVVDTAAGPAGVRGAGVRALKSRARASWIWAWERQK